MSTARTVWRISTPLSPLQGRKHGSEHKNAARKHCFRAGSSGNIGFALAPTAAGTVEVTLKISYENADQQVQTRLFPITLRAEEPVPADDFMDEGVEEEAQRAIPWPWLAGGGAVVVLAAGIGAALLLKRRKNAELAAQDSWDDWDEPAGAGDTRETGGNEP